MTNLELAISRLKILNLSAYPTGQLFALFKEFGDTGIIEYKLHKGKHILRARPDNNDGPFLTRSMLSFKPQEHNKTYQRASSPNRTMFYGSIIPDEIDNGDLDNERFIVTMEAIKWLRDNSTCGYKKITYSKWEVTSDIKLFAVLHKKEYYSANSKTRKLIDEYNEFIAGYPAKQKASQLAAEFLAEEFGKEECEPDYNYLLSAHFTEFITSMGFDGVLYPSVRVGGRGYNIAFTPDTANNKIKLIVAGECSIYKRFKNSLIDNETVVEITNDQVPFVYAPVDPRHRAGEKNCLRKLGVNRFDQLCEPE